MMNTKRSFDQLSDVEKDALRKVDEASRALIPKTFNGTCALARELTNNRSLQPRDDDAQVYTQLRNEGWIVVRHYDQSAKMMSFRVCDDYLELQSV